MRREPSRTSLFDLNRITQSPAKRLLLSLAEQALGGMLSLRALNRLYAELSEKHGDGNLLDAAPVGNSRRLSFVIGERAIGPGAREILHQ